MPRRRPPFPVAPFIWMAAVILLWLAFNRWGIPWLAPKVADHFTSGLVPTPTPAKR